MIKLSALAAVAAVVVAATGMQASAQDARPQVAQAPTAPVALATGQGNDDPELQCDVLEVKRVSGGALLIRWRFTNTAGATGQASLTGGGAPGKTLSLPPLDRYHESYAYYIDPAENKKYLVINDSNGDPIAGVSGGNLAPGQQKLNWVKFAAPPAGSTKISLTIQGFAPFEDLPISQ
jgi:hypothetical protein